MPRLFDAETNRWLDTLTLSHPVQVRVTDRLLATAEHAELRIVTANGSSSEVTVLELDLFVAPKALGKMAEAGGRVPFAAEFVEQMGESSRGIVTFTSTAELVKLVAGVWEGDPSTAATAIGSNDFPGAFDLELYEFETYVEVAAKESKAPS